MTRTTVFHGLCVLLALSLAACGGGGGGDGDVPSIQATLEGEPTLDGLAFNNASPFGGGAAVGPAAGIIEEVNLQRSFRGIFGFDLGSIPGNATVLSAELRIRQTNVQGTPYAVLGNLLVDHIEMGAVFDTNAFTDFTLSVVTNGGGQPQPISTDGVTANHKTLDVTDEVVDDLATARGRSQFRLRFENDLPNGMRGTHMVNLGDAEGVATIAPALHIVYVEP